MNKVKFTLPIIPAFFFELYTCRAAEAFYTEKSIAKYKSVFFNLKTFFPSLGAEFTGDMKQGAKGVMKGIDMLLAGNEEMLANMLFILTGIVMSLLLIKVVQNILRFFGFID